MKRGALGLTFYWSLYFRIYFSPFHPYWVFVIDASCLKIKTKSFVICYRSYRWIMISIPAWHFTCYPSFLMFLLDCGRCCYASLILCISWVTRGGRSHLVIDFLALFLIPWLIYCQTDLILYLNFTIFNCIHFIIILFTFLSKLQFLFYLRCCNVEHASYWKSDIQNS